MIYALIAGNLLMVSVFVIFFNRLPPQIPIFPSKIWGEDQLGELWMIFIIPLLMNGFYVLNNLIIRKMFPLNSYVKKIILYVNWGIIVSLTFIFLKIIFTVI